MQYKLHVLSLFLQFFFNYSYFIHPFVPVFDFKVTMEGWGWQSPYQGYNLTISMIMQHDYTQILSSTYHSYKNIFKIYVKF